MFFYVRKQWSELPEKRPASGFSCVFFDAVSHHTRGASLPRGKWKSPWSKSLLGEKEWTHISEKRVQQKTIIGFFSFRWFRLQLLGYGYLNFCETISRVNWAVSSGPCPKMTASLFLGRFNHKVWMKWPQFVPCPYHPGITKARCGDSCSLTYVPSS